MPGLKIARSRFGFLFAFATIGFAVPVTAGAEEKVRVACVGDSITWGAGVKNRAENCYPKVLGNLLGEKYEVKNFGKSGYTLLKKGDRPYWPTIKAVDAFKPDVVIIKLGSNDSKPQNWKHREEFDDDLAAMVGHFKELPTRPEVWVCLPAAVVKSNFGITDEVVRQQLPIIREVAKAQDVTVIDTYTPFVNRKDLMVGDGVHPNAAGAKVLAETVHMALAP